MTFFPDTDITGFGILGPNQKFLTIKKLDLCMRFHLPSFACSGTFHVIQL